MKSLPVTNSLKKALVDDEDFEKLKAYTWYINNDKGLQTTFNYQLFNMPNIIFNNRLMYDHKDRNTFNNQKENLRLCTQAQNCANRAKQNGKYTSKYKGVTFDKTHQIWVARITFRNKVIHLGRFTNEEQAARTYDKAALKYFKEFVVLNFPTDQEQT